MPSLWGQLMGTGLNFGLNFGSNYETSLWLDKKKIRRLSLSFKMFLQFLLDML